MLWRPNDHRFVLYAYFAATFEELGEVTPGDLAQTACLGLEQLHQRSLGTRAAAVAASLLAAAVSRVVSKHPGSFAASGDFVWHALNLAVLGDDNQRELSEEDLGGLQPRQLAVSMSLVGAASPLTLGAASVARVLQAGSSELTCGVFGAPEIAPALQQLFDQHLRAPNSIKDSLLPLMLCVPETSRATVSEALAVVLDERMAALSGQWLKGLRQREREEAAQIARWLVDVLALFYPVAEQKPPLGWLAPCPRFLPAMVGHMLSVLAGARKVAPSLGEGAGGAPSLAHAILTAFQHTVHGLDAVELAVALAKDKVLERLVKAALLFQNDTLGPLMATAAAAAAAAARRPVRGDARRRDRALEETGKQVVAETLGDDVSHKLRGAADGVKRPLSRAVLLLLRPRDAGIKHVVPFVVMMQSTLAEAAPLPGAPITLYGKELVWNSAAQALESVEGALRLAIADTRGQTLALGVLMKALDRIGDWLSLEAVPGVGAFAAALLDDARRAPFGHERAWTKEAIRAVGAGIEQAADEPRQKELWRLVCPNGMDDEVKRRQDLYRLMRDSGLPNADLARRVAERYQPAAGDLSGLRAATFHSLMAVARPLLDAHAHAKPAAEVAAKVARVLDRAAAAGNLRCAAFMWRAPPVSALADQPLAWQAAAALLAGDGEEVCLAGLGLLVALLWCCAGLDAPPCRQGTEDHQGLQNCKCRVDLLDQQKPYGRTTQAVVAALCGGLSVVVAAHPDGQWAAKATVSLTCAAAQASSLIGYAQTDTPPLASWCDAPEVLPSGAKAAEPTGAEAAGGPRPSASPACAVCGAHLHVPQVCGRCGVVRYCGLACQRADWRAHRLVCRAKANA